MAFTDVNIGAVADDGTGDPLRTAFQKINGNFAGTQVQLDAKADSQETQEALAGQQAQLNEKASLASFDNLTQRVQENATAINGVKYVSDLQQAAINNLQEQVGQAGAVEIATQTDIAAGTEGRVIDAAGLKTAGITTSAINTIAGKTGGKLAAGYSLFTSSASASGTVYTPEIASTGYNTSIGFGFYAKITYATSANTTDGYLYTAFGSSIKSWVFEGVSGILYSPGGVQQSCDRRLKTEIELIPDALNKVSKIAGCTFIINDTVRAGIIAQDLQAVLPEAIQISPVEIEKDGIKINDVLTVDAMGVIGLLVEAVKELSAKVEMLQSRSA